MLGHKARQRVEERYTLAKNIDQIEALYQNLLKEKRDRTARQMPFSGEAVSRWYTRTIEFPQRRSSLRWNKEDLDSINEG